MAIDKRWIVSLKGKDYPTWPGILDDATSSGLKSLITRIIQIPSPENGNLAVVMARAEYEDGRVFEDVGDCSPATTSPQLAAAALRLASTRAKGRVLRDGQNIGQTMYEELPPGAHDDEERPHPPRVQSSQGKVYARHEPGTEGTPSNGDTSANFCSECGLELTAGQKMVSSRAFGRPLCPACQKAVGKPAPA